MAPMDVIPIVMSGTENHEVTGKVWKFFGAYDAAPKRFTRVRMQINANP